MKQAIIRKTLTGDWEPFEFPKKSGSFFVKNFSDADVFVSFEYGDSENSSFKIPSMYGEEVSISRNGPDSLPFSTTTIYAKGTGEVEVQALDIYVDSNSVVLGESMQLGTLGAIQGHTVHLGNETIEDDAIVIE